MTFRANREPLCFDFGVLDCLRSISGAPEDDATWVITEFWGIGALCRAAGDAGVAPTSAAGAKSRSWNHWPPTQPSHAGLVRNSLRDSRFND